LNLETFGSELAWVHNDDDGLTLKFRDASVFDSAVEKWGWVNERETHQFIMITTIVDTDMSTFGLPYRITRMTSDTRHQTIHLAASESTFKEAIRNGHLRVEAVGRKSEFPSGLIPDRGSEETSDQHELRKRLAKSSYWERALGNATRRWAKPTGVHKRAPAQTGSPFRPRLPPRTAPFQNLTSRWEPPHANLTRRSPATARRWANATSSPGGQALHRRGTRGGATSSALALAGRFSGPVFQTDTASMACTSCSTSGSLSLALDVAIASHAVSKAFLEFSTQDLNVAFGFELEGFLKEPIKQMKHLWKAEAANKLNIPGLVTLDIGAESKLFAGVDLAGDGKFSVGMATQFSGRSIVCLVGCDSSTL
jgi:hypothetical protein